MTSIKRIPGWLETRSRTEPPPRHLSTRAQPPAPRNPPPRMMTRHKRRTRGPGSGERRPARCWAAGGPTPPPPAAPWWRWGGDPTGALGTRGSSACGTGIPPVSPRHISLEGKRRNFSVADMGCFYKIRIFPSRIPNSGSKRFRIRFKELKYF